MGLYYSCINYCLFVIIFLLITKCACGNEPKNIYCFFKSQSGDCISTYNPGFIVPASIIEAYNNLQPHIQSAIENGRCDMSDTDFLSISPVLLNLIPVNKLSSCNGSTLANVVKKNLNQTSLTVHIMEALKTTEQRTNFLKQIYYEELPKGALTVIAQSIIRWKNFEGILSTSLPLLPSFPLLVASFPPEYLWSLPDNVMNPFLHESSLNFSGVTFSQLTRRVLASLVLKKNPHILDRLMDLVATGFTADELGSKKLSKDKFKLDFDLLQARAVFKQSVSDKNTMLKYTDEYLPLIPKLTPELLQKFNSKTTHFSQISKFPNRESCATAVQIAEFIIAKAIDEGKLRDDSEWTEKIKYLGKWSYTLSPSELARGKLEKIRLSELQKVESHMLSEFQIYYLTNEGKSLQLGDINSILSTQSLLTSLPASQLITHKTGSIQSRVLSHLLMHLPGNNVPRTMAMLQKIWDELDNPQFFTALLMNKDVNNIVSLIPSWVIRKNAENILNVLKSKENQMAKTIQNLPPHFLAVLLKKEQEVINWKSETERNSYYYQNAFILGLTCDDIYKISAAHFITIMDLYNQMRITNNKIFPKNLQYCCMKKLIEYLELKSNLTQGNKNLINLLEPMEINAVGGFVLSGLPVTTIQASEFSEYIFKSISKLSVGELINAVGGNLTKLEDLANATHIKWSRYRISQNGNGTSYFLGNLLWFIKPDNLTKFKSHVRITIESKELDQRLCGTEAHRAAWSQYLISTFGSPDSWSSSVLSCLGDLLIVFSEKQLENINKTSWIEAADTMPSRLGEVTEGIQPQPFYQVCMSVLGESEGIKYLTALKTLTLWKLKAAQWQMDTINNALQICKKNRTVHIFDNDQVEPTIKTKKNNLTEIHIISGRPVDRNNINKFNEEKISANIVAYTNNNSESSSTKNKESDEYLNKGSSILSLSTESTSLSLPTDHSLSSTEHTPSPTDDNLSNKTTVSSISETHESIRESTTGETKSATQATSSKHPLLSAEESSQDMSDEEYIVTETGSIVERQKRETETIFKKISCNALIVVGHLASVVLSKNDIEAMPDETLLDCIEVFGKMNLVSEVQYAVWKRIHSLREENIPIPVPILGKIVQQMKASDTQLNPYNFSVPWDLEAVHTLLQNINDNFTLTYVTRRIRNINAAEETGSILSSLGTVICNFDYNMKQIQYAVIPLGKLKTCLQCLSNLTKAVIEHGDAGDVNSWKSDYVSSLGIIVTGVSHEQWLSLINSEHQPLSGLQPNAARCLSVDQLKVLNGSTLSIMSPLTLSVIEEYHSENLHSEQRAAIEHVKSLEITTDLLATDSVVEPTDSGSVKRTQSSFMVALSVWFIFIFVQCFQNNL